MTLKIRTMPNPTRKRGRRTDFGKRGPFLTNEQRRTMEMLREQINVVSAVLMRSWAREATYLMRWAHDMQPDTATPGFTHGRLAP